MQTDLVHYILQIADNSLIYGHRLSEWCGHGPILEVDMALTNIALDHIGAARNLYQYAAQLEGGGKTEDSYPYLRDVRGFRNALLLELPKGDFADTMARALYFDAFQVHFYTALEQSSDTQLAAIAEKSLKEVLYHLRFSSEWVVRLGDGTDESTQRMQQALLRYMEYTGELFSASEAEARLIEAGIAVNIADLKSAWTETVTATFEEAGLVFPLQAEHAFFQSGGKKGIHTEHLGFILAELQYMQRAYPNCEW